MNKLLKYLLGNRILQNILASLLLMVWFRMMMNEINSLSYIEQLGMVFTLIFPAIFISIVSNYFVIPYLSQKEYILAALAYVSIIGLGSWFFTYIAQYIHGAFCRFTICELNIQDILVSSLQIFSMVLMVSLLALALRITRDYMLEAHYKKQQQLKLLRSQLNPQFLLDILRKFSSLSAQNHSEVPQLMLTLSDLLRYTLYESKESEILLEKEYQALEKYLKLKRMCRPIEVVWEKRGPLENYKVVPMTLISVLENRFDQVSTSQAMAKKLRVSTIVEGGKLEVFYQLSTDPQNGVQLSFELEKKVSP